MSEKLVKGKSIKWLLYSNSTAESEGEFNSEPKIKYHLSQYRISPGVSRLPMPDFSKSKEEIEEDGAGPPNASSLPMPEF